MGEDIRQKADPTEGLHGPGGKIYGGKLVFPSLYEQLLQLPCLAEARKDSSDYQAGQSVLEKIIATIL